MPMATLLDGRQLAARIETRLADAISAGLPQAGRPPGLAVLRVGHDPASGVTTVAVTRGDGALSIRLVTR